MSVAEFIGDEVSAAGFRLCGIDVSITDGSDVIALIHQARKRASLVLVSSSAFPDVRGLHAVPDIVPRIHQQLGMLE